VSKTLLVVDDSATMRKVFELTLLSEEITLVTHDGSDSLLARARDVRPAAAIIDVNLASGLSGYDVCRALRADAAIGAIPVLMLASEQNPLDEAKLKDCGAEGSLIKPFETQALIDRIKQLLSQSQSQMSAVASGPTPKPTASITATPQPSMGSVAPPKAPSSAGAMGTSAPASMRPKATQVFGGVEPTPPMGPVSVAPQAASTVVSSPPLPSGIVQPTAVTPQSATDAAAVQSAPAPTVAAQPSAPATVASTISRELADKVAALGLTPAQVDAVAALTREVVERVVWEVVPQLAETMIREELRRLTS
jgi:DNA-binding response OmpR family regulator